MQPAAMSCSLLSKGCFVQPESQLVFRGAMRMQKCGKGTSLEGCLPLSNNESEMKCSFVQSGVRNAPPVPPRSETRGRFRLIVDCF